MVAIFGLVGFPSGIWRKRLRAEEKTVQKFDFDKALIVIAFAVLASLIVIWVNTANHGREHMTTAGVQTDLKQVADMTPDGAIDNSGKSPEEIKEEAKYRDLIRPYVMGVFGTRRVLLRRREAIDAKLSDFFQPKSYNPVSAKKIVAALDENIALNNDLQKWVNDIEPGFQARVNESGLADSEQQDVVAGFHESVANSPLLPTLHAYLSTDTELDQLSIEFYSAILRGNNRKANSYLDRIRALAKKDADLRTQVKKLAEASGKKAGLDGTEKIFQKTSDH